jgi:soluble lytic murein transglycosylase-like protein
VAQSSLLGGVIALLAALIGFSCGPKRPAGPHRTPAAAPAAAESSEPRDGTPDYRARELTPPRLSAEMHQRCRELQPIFERVGAEFGIEPALLMAVARVESGFRARARSRAGAFGIMQIMPRTARSFSCSRLHEPAPNIRCGAQVLQRSFERFGGSEVYALAAYNGGAGYVRAEYKAQRLPRNFRYVERVLKYFTHFQRYGCD